MKWYFILGIISYGIFIIKFILSLFSSEIDGDVDIDSDGDMDFKVSDLLSFKGLIHFAMGFSGYLIATDSITTINIIVGILIGIVFMVILYFVYRELTKLSYEPSIKEKENLIGEKVTILFPLSNDFYNCRLDDYRELKCKCCEKKNVGDILTIKSYHNNIYYIN